MPERIKLEHQISPVDLSSEESLDEVLSIVDRIYNLPWPVQISYDPIEYRHVAYINLLDLRVEAGSRDDAYYKLQNELQIMAFRAVVEGTVEQLPDPRALYQG